MKEIKSLNELFDYLEYKTIITSGIGRQLEILRKTEKPTSDENKLKVIVALLNDHILDIKEMLETTHLTIAAMEEDHEYKCQCASCVEYKSYVDWDSVNKAEKESAI